MDPLESRQGSGHFGRRRLLTMVGGGALALGLQSIVGCGSDDEEPSASTATAAGGTAVAGASPTTTLRASSNEKIKIGFIALTDCASVVMAQELGLFKEYGLNVDVVKQASWASTRDALLTNDIQAAHMLFGMPFSVYTGVGGPAGKEIHIAMMLNNNGQAITLSSEEFAGKVGHKDIGAVQAAVEALKAKTGSHLRDDVPRRDARHVAALLARRREGRPERRQDHHDPAAEHGRQHEGRQHGRLLRR